MSQNPPEGMPRVTPYLHYEDVAAALDWLSKAFGLTERLRIPGPDGKIGHAEMVLEEGVVMMGMPMEEYENPRKRGGLPTATVYIYVDDVDSHFERARSAGAEILRQPTDEFYGDRVYGAADPEGQRWFFATHVRDVPAEEMMEAAAQMAQSS